MSLNLDHHLLQPPDGLLAPLLRHFALKVILSTGTLFLDAILVLLRYVLRNSLLSLPEGSISIQPRLAAFRSLARGKVGSLCRIAGSSWVGRLGHIAGNLLSILLSKRN